VTIETLSLLIFICINGITVLTHSEILSVSSLSRFGH
jgi:hypothetical protein